MHGERVHVYDRFLPQAAVNLVALGMGVNIIRLNNPSLNQTSHHRMVVGHLFEPIGPAVEIRAAVADIGDVGRRANDQSSGHGGAHIRPILDIALVHGQVGFLDPINQQLCESLIRQRFVA